MRILVLAALIGSAFVGLSATPASAAPLCYSVATDGTLVPTTSDGTCIPYDAGTICQYENAGAWPQANLHLVACVPAPIVNNPPQ